MTSWWLHPALFLTGFSAGFVDSIAGGGGIITIPVLLNLGLPPQVALGTNKLQATFGSGSAAWHYGQAGLIDWSECRLGIVCTFLGAAGGSLCVQQLDPALLRILIPCLLVAIALYSLLQPKLGATDRDPRLPRAGFYWLAGLALGFYDGFFGPGTGSFWVVALVTGLGFNLLRATAHTKVMNFISNLASLLVFIRSGELNWSAGLVMGAGQLIGARLGSRVVIRRGVRFIRPIFIAAALAITGRLLWLNLRDRF